MSYDHPGGLAAVLVSPLDIKGIFGMVQVDEGW